MPRIIQCLLLISCVALLSLRAGGPVSAGPDANAQEGEPAGQEQPTGPTSTTEPDAPPALPEGELVPLEADFSAAVVQDVQGFAYVMPALANRFSMLRTKHRLQANDLVKTGPRGPNLVAMRLPNGALVLLGPDSQAQLLEGSKLSLLMGEADVSVPIGESVVLMGQGGSTISINDKANLRATDGGLVRLQETPKWLVGYRNDSLTESMGSLLANVDGRTVRLSIGQMRITVDIRDQIARTVVEQTFINNEYRSGHPIEGDFSFPLPADASISGFATWIGGRPVEADVVERERAREIYQTMLREKKDPGLLEWSQGNIFRARVFPIHSSKRIRITYTQVLRKTGDGFSYSFPMRSELLRTTPLRNVAVDVRVWSEQPLAAAKVRTYPSRVSVTQRAARMQFSATDFVPERDFEAEVSLIPGDTVMSLVTHQRGDDGYFLLRVDSPKAGGEAKRPERLDVLIVADTSASVAGQAAETQAAALDAILESLGPNDRFNLLMGDADRSWAFAEALPASHDCRRRAREAHASRPALGWTDLQSLLGEAMRRARPETHVIVLSDGLHTASADQAGAVAQYLRDTHTRGTFHAVATGNLQEPVVLQAISELGGGTARKIGDPSEAASVIQGLLDEIEQPGMRDLSIRFTGIETAAVYPSVLPNLRDGAQHIITGRYNPAVGIGGRVEVAGLHRGKPFTAGMDASPTDRTDNSFVPRFWARNHIDSLLAQPLTAETKQRVVDLSQDFQIISRLTSLIVIADEETRQRFRIERTTRMRDGEEFFQEGRDNAMFELTRAQMLVARSWRLELHRQAVEYMRTMGRGLTGQLATWSPSRPEFPWQERRYSDFSAVTATMDPSSGEWLGAEKSEFATGVNSAVGGGRGGAPGRMDRARSAGDVDSDGGMYPPAPESSPMESGEDVLDDENAEFAKQGGSSPEDKEFDNRGEPVPSPQPREEGPSESLRRLADTAAFAGREMRDSYYRPTWWGWSYSHADHASPPSLARTESLTYWGSSGFGHIFPALAGRSTKPRATPWPSELSEQMGLIDYHSRLVGMSAGADLSFEYFDRAGVATSNKTLLTVSGGQWSQIVDAHSGGSTNWLVDQKRGVLAHVWNAARARDAEAGDEWGFWMPAELTSYLRINARSITAVRSEADGVITISATSRSMPGLRWEYQFGSDRQMLQALRFYQREKLQRTLRYSEHFDVHGITLPGVIETLDADGAVVSSIQISGKALEGAEAVRLIRERATLPGDAISMGRLPLRAIDAREEVLGGSPSLEAAWAVLSEHNSTLGWQRAEPVLQLVLPFFRDKLAQPVLLGKLAEAQGNPQLAREIFEAELLRRSMSETYRGQVEAVETLVGMLMQHSVPSQQLDHLRTMIQVFTGLSIDQDRMLWLRLREANLVGQIEGALSKLTMLQQLADENPSQQPVQMALAEVLVEAGRIDEALGVLSAIQANDQLSSYERRQAFERRVSLLVDWRTRAEALEQIAAVLEDSPALAQSSHYFLVLTLLTESDRMAEADAAAFKWLAPEQLTLLESQAVSQQIEAAIRFSAGQSYWRWWSRPTPPEYLPVLAKLMRAAWEGEDSTLWLVQRLANTGHFIRSLPARELAKQVFAEVRAAAATMSTRRIEVGLQVASSSGEIREHDPKVMEALVEALSNRWETTQSQDEADALVSLVRQWGTSAQHLKLARRVLARESDPYRIVDAAQSLLSLLQSHEAYETGRITEYSNVLNATRKAIESLEPFEHELEQATNARITQMHAMVTAAVDAKANQAERVAQDNASLGRQELERRRPIWRSEAMQELHTELTSVAQVRQDDPALLPWIGLELITLAARSGSATSAELIKALQSVDDALEALRQSGKSDLNNLTQSQLRIRVLIHRAWLAAAQLAHLSRVEEAGKQVRSRLDAMLELEVLRDTGELLVQTWLLVQADAVGLRQTLQSWASSVGPAGQAKWGAAIGVLWAEQGDFGEALRSTILADQKDVLVAEDFRRMASWYKCLDRKSDWKSAMAESYRRSNEWELIGALQSHGWNRNHANRELDEMEMLQLQILMEKATDPTRHAWNLRRIYSHTQDFRIPAVIVSAVPGASLSHTISVVGLVQDMLREVRLEAAMDRVRDAASKIAPDAPGTTTAQRRAGHLMRAVVSLATDQRQGTAQHVRDAIASLRAAAEEAWLPGERATFAGFLQGLSSRASAGMLAGLEELFNGLRAGVPATSRESLQIAIAHAAAISSQANVMPVEQLRSARMLEAALTLHRHPESRILPHDLLGQQEVVVNRLVAAGQHRVALATVNQELGLPYQQSQLWEMESWQISVLNATVRDVNNESEALAAWQQAHQLLLSRTAVAAPDHLLRQREQQIMSVFRTALRQTRGRTWEKLSEAGNAGLTDWLWNGLPRLLRSTQGRLSQSAVSGAASLALDRLGADVAMEFMLSRAENEPDWLKRVGRDFWPSNARLLATTRFRLGAQSRFNDRLMAVVTTELLRDLELGQVRTRYIYGRAGNWDESLFWEERHAEFLALAVKVAESHPEDPSVTLHVANYVRSELRDRAASLSLLESANARGILRWNDLRVFASWLEDDGRTADARQVVLGMLSERPEDWSLRTWDIRLLVKLGESTDALNAARKLAAEKHEKNEWGAGVAQQLAAILLPAADSAQDCLLQAEEWMVNAVELRLRDRQGRLAGDSVLGGWLSSLSNLHSRTGKHIKAVEAAAGSMVAYGSGRRSESGRQALAQALAAADLNAVADWLEAEVLRSGTENPILRGAIADAALAVGNWDLASRQYDAAAAVAPENPEYLSGAAKAHEEAGRIESAVSRVIRMLHERPSDAAVVSWLAGLYTKRGDADSAWRALTTLAESDPGDGSGYQRLAAQLAERREHLRAAEQYAVAATKSPNDPEPVLERIRNLIRGDEHKQAAAEAREAAAREWPATAGNVREKLRQLLQQELRQPDQRPADAPGGRRIPW